jgi:predicted glycoside hydrolase/deacetylase ChbG (UPF0249 family)
MKLLVQSDDFGISRAVSLGCIHGIRNGVIRNTGMFANMPWIEECVEEIRPYLGKIAFGIDLNISTGPSILGHDKLPSLTHEDGSFRGSKEHAGLDNDDNSHDHLAAHRDEVYAEFKAQTERYIRLIGHKPDYIHNHAYCAETVFSVSRQLAEEYHCPYSDDVMRRPEVKDGGMGWYGFGGPEVQLKNDPVSWFTSDQPGMLGSEYGYIICHCGWADADLFRLSSFNACRVIDLDCMVSQQMKTWVKDNGIELITFRDLPEEWSR